MNAHRIHWGNEAGEPIQLSKTEASTLTSFRRSAYAKPLRDAIEKALASARFINEEQPASETNRHRVNAVKDVMAVLFDSPVELEK